MSCLKVMAVTVSRADYGLLYPLMHEMNKDIFFDLKLVATGSHLSEIHGKTIEEIRKDGFQEISEIDISSSDDTPKGICLAMANELAAFAELLQRQEPQLLILLGDRYELWPAAMAAVIHRIPIAHVHGGEVTVGAIDETVRHSITKMAVIHFPSIDLYAQRVMQMGEDPKRVFTVGALGIDNIKNIELMNKKELNDFTGLDFNFATALMTYHPVTTDDCAEVSGQIKEILDALLKTNLNVLITMPNADPGWNSIYSMIKLYSDTYPDKFKFVKNLGQKAYLSAMKYSKIMIGNSSSGIIESASFRLPVINIGDRQAGRFKPKNVLDCACNSYEIAKAIEIATSEKFCSSLTTLENPYGNGKTAEKIIQILKNIDFSDIGNIIKKKFFDIRF